MAQYHLVVMGFGEVAELAQGVEETVDASTVC